MRTLQATYAVIGFCLAVLIGAVIGAQGWSLGALALVGFGAGAFLVAVTVLGAIHLRRVLGLRIAAEEEGGTASQARL